MSARALNWAWQQNPPTASQKLVLAALADRADDEGICYPSIKWVAAKCAPLSPRTVRRCLTELCQYGLVVKVARLRRPDGTLGAWTYRLVLEATSGTGWPVEPVAMGGRAGTVEQVLPLETYVSSANGGDSAQKSALGDGEDPHDTAVEATTTTPSSPSPSALDEGAGGAPRRKGVEPVRQPSSSSAPVPAGQAAPGDPRPPLVAEGPPVTLDALWDACEQHVQKAPTAKSHRKAYAKLVRELLEAGWTPEQVASRSRAYRKNAMTREWPLTLAALAKWGEHVASHRAPPRAVNGSVAEPVEVLPQPENARRMRELLEGMA